MPSIESLTTIDAYQAWRFAALSVLGGILILRLVITLRVRFVAAQMKRLAEERADERIRIARDLHDTLLQGVAALMIRFQYAAREVAEGHNAGNMLESALAAADRVLLEGRDRVKHLRQEGHVNLPEALAIIGTDFSWHNDVKFSVAVEGESLALRPDVQEEIYGIGREAIANAFHHARPSRIEVVIEYRSNTLRLACRDDGIGMDPASLQQGSVEGHWGLLGMRERANRINATFQQWSKMGAGTEIVVSVPARRAYLHHASDLWSFIGRQRTGRSSSSGLGFNDAEKRSSATPGPKRIWSSTPAPG